MIYDSQIVDETVCNIHVIFDINRADKFEIKLVIIQTPNIE